MAFFIRICCIFLSGIVLPRYIWAADVTKPCDILAEAANKLTKQPSVSFSRDHDVIEREIRPHWSPSSFTNPLSHDPNNFIYIIRVGSAKSASKKALISASVIARRPDGTEFIGFYPGLFGSVDALILKVPPEDIVLSYESDTSRLSTSSAQIPPPEVLRSWEAHYGMYTPQAMIDASIVEQQRRYEKTKDSRHYNEIIYKGSNQVQIVGIAAIGRTNSGDEARKWSKDLGGVPVVEIKPQPFRGTNDGKSNQ